VPEAEAADEFDFSRSNYGLRWEPPADEENESRPFVAVHSVSMCALFESE